MDALAEYGKDVWFSLSQEEIGVELLRMKMVNPDKPLHELADMYYLFSQEQVVAPEYSISRNGIMP
jgi:hypothetical protein